MSEEYYQLNFSRYFKAIYRQKWLVIVCLSASIALALIAGKSEMPLYQARTSFWVREMKGERGVLFEKLIRLSFTGQTQPLGTDYSTQIEIMKSPLILRDVVKKLDLPSKTKGLLSDSINSVRASISISLILNTSILEVKALHPSPELAVKTANAVCEAYIEFNKKLFLEQEQIRLRSMEAQARLAREGMGKTNDLITEKIKRDMYLLLVEKIAETRLNISLGQSERVKIIDKAETADLFQSMRALRRIFFMGMMGLFSGIVLAVAVDTFKKKGV